MSIELERNRQLYEEIVSKYRGCDNVFKWFISLNEVPRKSNFTEQATAWALEAGKRIGASACLRDARGNVCLHFPATPGKENQPSIVMQAHLDMVGTAVNPDFDFTKHQLEMYLDGPLLRAKGTTLGADDGSGVAIALALAEDKSFVHAPLEILLTVDEETGLEGAVALKEGELLSDRAKYLINVDSEDFGEICLSCAGAALRVLSIPLQRGNAPTGWRQCVLTLSNFVGGHTGVDIHLGHANALKWAALLLSDNHCALEGVPYRIAEFVGGNAHNAVPSAVVVGYLVPEDRADDFNKAMATIFDALSLRWKNVETKVPLMQITAPKQPFATALTFTSSRGLCNCIGAIHHGVWTWSENIDTLVETSESLSIANLTESTLEITVFARSSHNYALKPVCDHLCSVAAIYGGTCAVKGTDMSGWPAEPNSRLARTAVAVFQQVVGTPANVTSIHAGLECGIIMGKYPTNRLEAISVGPTVKNPHTVNEYLDVGSVLQLYNYLSKLVEKLSE